MLQVRDIQKQSCVIPKRVVTHFRRWEDPAVREYGISSILYCDAPATFVIRNTELILCLTKFIGEEHNPPWKIWGRRRQGAGHLSARALLTFCSKPHNWQFPHHRPRTDEADTGVPVLKSVAGKSKHRIRFNVRLSVWGLQSEAQIQSSPLCGPEVLYKTFHPSRDRRRMTGWSNLLTEILYNLCI